MEPETVIDRLRQHQPSWAEALEVWKNPGPSGQHALLVSPPIIPDIVRGLAAFLRDDPELRFDFCSNVTGVDWLEAGYLEAVYHLYSVALRHGPLILRLRTADRKTNVHLPSLTAIWKSAELQEREIYDLYGIVFDGHPDLRRLLLWDEFEGHPMRKDYQDPDDMIDTSVAPVASAPSTEGVKA